MITTLALLSYSHKYAFLFRQMKISFRKKRLQTRRNLGILYKGHYKFKFIKGEVTSAQGFHLVFACVNFFFCSEDPGLTFASQTNNCPFRMKISGITRLQNAPYTSKKFTTQKCLIEFPTGKGII